MSPKKLVNKPVYIEWKDSESNWHWFRLLDTAMWLNIGWLYLQGRNSPEGVEHDGKRFWVPINEVSMISAYDSSHPVPPGANPHA